MDQEIIFEQKDGLGHVTLNRPNALNALTQSMTVSLYQKLQIWALSRLYAFERLKTLLRSIFHMSGLAE